MKGLQPTFRYNLINSYALCITYTEAVKFQNKRVQILKQTCPNFYFPILLHYQIYVAKNCTSPCMQHLCMTKFMSITQNDVVLDSKVNPQSLVK